MIKLIKDTKLLKKRNLLINIVIFILSYAMLYKYFKGIEINTLSSFFRDVLSDGSSLLLLLLLILLGCLNWLIESIKWRYLVSNIYKMSMFDSVKSVLIGVFFSLFIPNRAGDFLGRVYSINQKEKGKLSILTLLGSYAQLIATLLWGVIGCSYFLIEYFDSFSIYFIYASSFIAIGWVALFVAVLLYFKIGTITRLKYFNKWKLLTRVHSWTLVLKDLPKAQLLSVFTLSLIRYLVFAFQLWLAYRLLGIDANTMDLFFFVTVYYLLLTFIPTIVLSEIGVRGALSIYLFKFFMFLTSMDVYDFEWSVSFASILVWIINIIIPSIVGSFYSYKLKFIAND